MVSENGPRPGERKQFSVTAEDAGTRLDTYLACQAPGQSRSRIQKLVEDKLVLVNGTECEDKNYRLKEGDQVSLTIPPPAGASIEGEDIRLDVIYEDSDLLVINKPRGMVVHPGPGHREGTLVNALVHHCDDLSGIGGVMRPGIVHRLDKDTSGLLIAAKNDFAHRSLSDQLKAREIQREYIALVHGQVSPGAGRIEAPIARHPRHRKKMAVVAGGREAVTRYRAVKYYQNYTLLKIKLETGRTHQIRVHLSHLGYPVVGDETYAKGGKGDLPDELLAAQALHARRLAFTHPRTGETMQFSAPLPGPFKKVLTWLKNR